MHSYSLAPETLIKSLGNFGQSLKPSQIAESVEESTPKLFPIRPPPLPAPKLIKMI